MSARANPSSFEHGYFNRYLKRNLVGIPAGARMFPYAFWERYIRKLTKPNARILEVGCGLGFFASRLARRFSVVGLDISLEALSFARQRWGFRSLIRGDAEFLPYLSETFDVVIALDVIEHLAQPEAFLAEAARVLHPGGVLVLTTPNPASLGARVKCGTSEIDQARIWFGVRDKTHINVRPIDQWRRSFSDNCFKVIRDGTDFLWDPPYWNGVPVLLQRLAFVGTQWFGAWLVGFLPWRLGENYVAALRKQSPKDPSPT
jgi:SAM-dependent methyltransferase